MALIDERGRLFGRVNLIDLAVGVFCLLLVPLAYGAYTLFRTPRPVVATIVPATLVQGPDLRVKLTGTGFRPFMRASVGVQGAPALLVASPSMAEVVLPDLPPGTYPLILGDESREVARIENAITITGPPPPPQVVLQVSGTFTAVPQQTAASFSAGARFPAGSAEPLVEILTVRPSTPVVLRVPTALGILERPMPGMVRLPAVLRIRCTPAGEACTVGGVALAAGATIPVPVGGALAFRIFDVSAADKSPAVDAEALRQTVEIDARFATSPETLEFLAPGAVDVDRRFVSGEMPSPPAVLLSFKRERDFNARSSVDWLSSEISTAPQVLDVPRTLTFVDATLRVPLQRTAVGWQYKGAGVKLGAPLTFDAPLYTLRGWILRIRFPRTAPPRAGGK